MEFKGKVYDPFINGCRRVAMPWKELEGRGWDSELRHNDYDTIFIAGQFDYTVHIYYTRTSSSERPQRIIEVNNTLGDEETFFCYTFGEFINTLKYLEPLIKLINSNHVVDF